MAVTVITEGVRYIKIAKIDKDGVDQTNTYENLTKLTIPFSSGPIVYDILSITEYPTYFLYYVVNPNLEWNDRADLEYDFTGSLNDGPAIFLGPIQNSRNFPITSIVDNLSFLVNSINSNGYSNDEYILKTYPQKEITTRASGSILSVDSPGDTYKISLNLNGIIQDSIETSSIPLDFDLSFLSSLLTPNSIIDVVIRNTSTAGVTPTWTTSAGSRLLLSSTTALGPEIQTIPEPYFNRDFSRALDCQPTLNNVFNNRRSTKYQDVDYSEGLLTPNNYDLIISGSALKAEVQDSNYTLLRHTRPRYEGSKSTSRFINKWTKNDVGTYGTSPTVESLKTILVYSTAISSSEPEIMNSSEIFVKYLIKADGDVIIPNTTPNSVDDNKDTFLSGELIEINTQDKPGSGGSQFRSIIRGGKRVEPILYTQKGFSPIDWVTEIELTDFNNIGGVSSNFQALLGIPTIQSPATDGTWLPVDFTKLLSVSSDSGVDITAPRLVISPEMIAEGISLNLVVKLNFKYNQPYGTTAYARIRNVTLNYTVDNLEFPGNGSYNSYNVFGTQNSEYATTGENQSMNFQVNIPYTDLVDAHEYEVQVLVANDSTGNGYTIRFQPSSTFAINQTPTPNNAISSSGLWLSGSTLTNPNTELPWVNTLTTSGSLVDYFNSNNTYQSDIPDSFFKPIDIPWSVKSGDEFRFEGREDRTFLVKDAYVTGSVSGSILVVEVDKPIPPSGSMNLDQFLIRRYVDDASSIIINGFKPISSIGPYIVKPEYTIDELNKDIDSYIENLTEKGLI